MMGRGRAAFVLLSAAALMATACGRPASVIERGALLVRISAPPEIAVDELRMWIYDDGGTLFDGQRIPAAGALPPPKTGGELGTVLVQPGAARGDLRIHVRGFAAGLRRLDGAGRVDLNRVTNGSYDLALFAVVPNDADGDDVPDDLDDCPARANPQQGGCLSPTMDASDDGGGGQSAADGRAAEAGNTGGIGGSPTGGAGGGTGGAAVGTGGASGVGGAIGTGGRSATGGAVGTGGVVGTGGRAGTGGAPGTGGTPDAGAPDAMRDSGGVELPRKNQGATCGAAAECATGFCVDGVCCESACNQECRVCAPLLGQCLDVSRAPDVPQCAGTRTCNAAARCVLQ